MSDWGEQLKAKAQAAVSRLRRGYPEKADDGKGMIFEWPADFPYGDPPEYEDAEGLFSKEEQDMPLSELQAESAEPEEEPEEEELEPEEEEEPQEKGFDGPGPGYIPAKLKMKTARIDGYLFYQSLSEAMLVAGLSPLFHLRVDAGEPGFSVDYEEPQQIEAFTKALDLPEPERWSGTATWSRVLVLPNDLDALPADADVSSETRAELRKRFDPAQPRDDEGRWTDVPGGGGGLPFESRLFATPARSEYEDVSAYYESPRWKQFEADVRFQAKELGLEIEGEDLTEGIWATAPEPSATFLIKGDRQRTYRLAARVGRRWNQDAVLNFTPGEGSDAEYRFFGAGKGNDAAAVLKAAEDHGLFGATRNGDDIVVVAGPSMGGEDRDALAAFGSQLGASRIRRYPGTARLIEDEEYDTLDPEDRRREAI